MKNVSTRIKNTTSNRQYYLFYIYVKPFLRTIILSTMT